MLKRFVLFTAVVVFPLHRAAGGVVFSQSGNDLAVEITTPISFTSIATQSETLIAILLEDVYSSPPSIVAAGIPTSGTTTMTAIDVSDGYNVWANLNFTSGSIDPTDFYGYFTFPNAQSLTPGQVITVSAGTVTVPDFFDFGRLPDLPVTTATLVAGSTATALTAPVVVPEPSTVICGLIAVLAGCGCRIKRKVPKHL